MAVGQSRVGETALASTLSSLFQPVALRPADVPADAPTDVPTDVKEYPEGMFVQAAVLLAARRLAPAASLLQRLDSITARRPDGRRWKCRVEFLWAVHAEQTGDVRSVLEHCTAAVASVRSLPASDCPTKVGSEGSLPRAIDAVVTDGLPLLTARAHIGLGQPEQAEAILLERFGDRQLAEIGQPAIMAMLACCRGRLGDALRLATAAVQAAERRDPAAEMDDLEARLVLANVFVERNQLDAAWRQLLAAQRLLWLSGATAGRWAVELDLGRVLVAQGRAGEAVHRLEHLRVEAASFLSQPLLRKLNQLLIECQLELGDTESALLIAKSNRPQDVPRETLARLDLCAGRPDRALSRIDAPRSSNLGVEIRRLVVRACAEKQQGRIDRAHDAIRRAVDAASPERYVRPFLEQAAHILPLLRGVVGSSRDPYLTDLVGAAEQVAPSPFGGRHDSVLEPLTDREREILRHLPSHLTLRQVGLAMCLSTNTVKTHVKAIYRKVGAISRDDAVTIARELGLL
jgi:DNA-binding CsgD family transcriptional regulator